MGKVYSNIGKKLRMIAFACGALGLLAFVTGLFIEIVTLFDKFNGMVLLCCGISGILLFLGSWPLYAFGQLVDDVHDIKNSTSGLSVAGMDELPDL